MRTIGALAKTVGLNKETIRFYEKRGLLPEPARSEGGHRLYNELQERRLAFIRHARDLGFSLDDISELISLAEGKESLGCGGVLSMAERHLQTVNTKLAQLQGIHDTLLRLTTDCRVGEVCTEARACNILEDLATPLVKPKHTKPAELTTDIGVDVSTVNR